MLGQHIPDGKEVTQGFGHLLLIYPHSTGVHPGINIGFAGGRFALRDLVFMMWKREIWPTTMNVEGITQAAGRHRRALDVPARTAITPGGSPVSLAWFGSLPKHEIERVFFMNIHIDPTACTHIIELAIIELAVVGKLAHPVVDITIFSRVGKAFFNQRFNHGHNIADMAGSTGFMTGRKYIQTRFIFVHGINHTLGQRGDTFAVFIGALEDFIVDISDVTHVVNVVTTLTQIAGDDVEGDHHPGVPQVAVVIHRHAANIHTHFTRHKRGERFFATRQRIVNVHVAIHVFLALLLDFGPAILQPYGAVKDQML